MDIVALYDGRIELFRIVDMGEYVRLRKEFAKRFKHPFSASAVAQPVVDDCCFHKPVMLSVRTFKALYTVVFAGCRCKMRMYACISHSGIAGSTVRSACGPGMAKVWQSAAGGMWIP
ncbi:hypothetical protein DSM101010T_33510 [Desulfovibrio subterraneus]|uniref:Uncharacterized protein n=1 Tax=Desulfovibrio subterraneus TaxID=2718620 RepID=A0A7J0BMT2_9BACT|nr:hypothetical protein DSM101010T_33510 [Desulfovibrio subterraneus]